MLGKIADFDEDEVDRSIASLTSIVEPLMMIFVGTMVGSSPSRCTSGCSSCAHSSVGLRRRPINAPEVRCQPAIVAGETAPCTNGGPTLRLDGDTV
jgi:hypothetical protein